MRFIIFLLPLFAFAKPTQEKTIAAPAEPPIVIDVQLVGGPRKPSQVESVVMLSPSVQACLRASDLVRQRGFSVTLNGRWDENGTPIQVTADTSDMLLKSCLERAVTQISADQGASGDFELRIFRSRVFRRGKKAKGLILDLKPIKKFE